MKKIFPQKKSTGRGRPRGGHANDHSITIRYARVKRDGRPTAKNLYDIQCYINLMSRRGLGHAKRMQAYKDAMLLFELYDLKRKHILASNWWNNNTNKGDRTAEFNNLSKEEKVVLATIAKQLLKKEMVDGWSLFPSDKVEGAAHVVTPVIKMRGGVTLCRAINK